MKKKHHVKPFEQDSNVCLTTFVIGLTCSGFVS